jgi:hypothetical protein
LYALTLQELFSAASQHAADVALANHTRGLWVAPGEAVEAGYRALDGAVRPLLEKLGIAIAACPTSPEVEWRDACELLRGLLCFPLLDAAIGSLQRAKRPRSKPPANTSAGNANEKKLRRSPRKRAKVAEIKPDLAAEMKSLWEDPPKDWVAFEDPLRLVSNGRSDRQFGDGVFIVDVTMNDADLDVIVNLPDTYRYQPTEDLTTAMAVRGYCDTLLSGACYGNRAVRALGKRGGGNDDQPEQGGWLLLAEDQINPAEDRTTFSRPLPDTASPGGYAYRNQACTGVAPKLDGRVSFRCYACSNIRTQTQRRARSLQEDLGVEAGVRRPFVSQTRWQLRQTAARLSEGNARLKRLLKRFHSHESDSISLLDDADRQAMDAMILEANKAKVPAAELQGCPAEPPQGGTAASTKGKDSVKTQPAFFSAIDAMFPTNTSNRAVWDDMVQNITKRGVGNGGAGCRYSASTMNVAMSVLMKTGQAAYTELAQIFCLPTARTLRKAKAGAMQCGVMFDSIDSIFRKIKREIESDKRILEANAVVGVLSWDAMEIKGGLLWSPKYCRVVGMTIMDSSLATVQREFSKTVDVAAGTEITSELVTATKYQVFYWTSLGAKNVAFPVAKVPMVSCRSSDLFDILRDVEHALVCGGLTTVAYVSDGAADNRGLFSATKGERRPQTSCAMQTRRRSVAWGSMRASFWLRQRCWSNVAFLGSCFQTRRTSGKRLSTTCGSPTLGRLGISTDRLRCRSMVMAVE